MNENLDDPNKAVIRSIIYFATVLQIVSATSTDLQIRQEFNSWFGSSPTICALLWNHIRMQGPLPRGCTPIHLLWALIFLRTYVPMKVMKKLFKADAKTIRKWIWYMVKSIANVSDDVIVWNRRFAGYNPYKCKVTVDGTDFRVRNAKPFRPQWYSYKFKTAALRYEVAVCIATGHIVWINGPYPAATHDVTIFRKNLKHQLNGGERVEADGGYVGERLKASTPKDFRSEEHRKAKQRARSRHEHINGLLKDFACLGQKFRHDPMKHANAMWAVAVLIQLSIMHNEKNVWNVEYVGEESIEYVG